MDNSIGSTSRRGLALLFLAVAVAGCGGTASAPTPTAVTLARYKDAKFGFSFRYPSSLKVASAGGHVSNLGGVPTYILDVSVPNNSAQLSITVDTDVTQFPPFTNGHTAPDPSGSAHTFQYFHARVAGWPAMVIHRFSGKQITEIDTVTNTRSHSYDVRMLTATPPFSSDALAGYHTIVRSLTVPFS